MHDIHMIAYKSIKSKAKDVEAALEDVVNEPQDIEVFSDKLHNSLLGLQEWLEEARDLEVIDPEAIRYIESLVERFEAELERGDQQMLHELEKISAAKGRFQRFDWRDIPEYAEGVARVTGVIGAVIIGGALAFSGAWIALAVAVAAILVIVAVTVFKRHFVTSYGEMQSAIQDLYVLYDIIVATEEDEDMSYSRKEVRDILDTLGEVNNQLFKFLDFISSKAKKKMVVKAELVELINKFESRAIQVEKELKETGSINPDRFKDNIIDTLVRITDLIHDMMEDLHKLEKMDPRDYIDKDFADKVG